MHVDVSSAGIGIVAQALGATVVQAFKLTGNGLRTVDDQRMAKDRLPPCICPVHT